MRTIKFYTTLSYYLIRYVQPLIRRTEKLKENGKLLEAFQTIDNMTVKVTGKLIKIAGAKVNVKGLENIDPNETYLIVSNHQGNYDIPLLYTFSSIGMAFVAKKEMETLPLIGKLMKQRGCIFLDRENPRESIKSVQEGIDLLKKGGNLAVFPEGKRSKGMVMNEFKPGAFRLAQKSGVKVLPVVIKGSYKLMEANKGKIRPASVEIEFLQPVESKKYKDATSLCNEVEQLIKSNLSD